MPLHDSIHVGGVSESCKYNSHEECRAPNCACSCHKPTPNPSIPQVAEAGPEKACPKCGSKRPFNETYCRVDGERLASLLCGMCGAGMNPEDAFCYRCGAPKGTIGVGDPLPTVPVEVEVTPLVQANYEEQVLRGLQEELGGPTTQVEPQAQRVVEQPAGSQGSFKIVNAPNPNKLRGSVTTTGEPRKVIQQPTRQAIRLPIKPA